MGRNEPIGYTWQDGKLHTNKTESNLINWIYKMIIEYSDNPPETLIKEVIDKYEKEEISYAEAKEQVSIDKVKKYMVEELNLRIEQFEKNKQEDTPSELERFLEIPLDKELLDIVEKRYKSNYQEAYNINPFLENKIGRYFKDAESLSRVDYKLCEGEPLISIETYKDAGENIEKRREQSSDENTNSYSTMRLE